jgi:hypothetical protein
MAAGFASHDPKVLSILEIAGSYQVDCLFNHVYAGARSNLGGGASLTDEYIRRVQAYVLGVKSDERCYGDVVQGLHRYFASTTRYTALSFADFVDRVVGVCIPEDYFRQLTTQDKDEMLGSILCDLVSNLAAFVTRPDALRRVIDEHDRAPAVTIRMLQDEAVRVLLAKRAALHNKFLCKMGQAREHVAMDVVDDMKRALRRLAKEKTEALVQAEEAEEAAGHLKKELAAAREREAKLRQLVELLRAEGLPAGLRATSSPTGPRATSSPMGPRAADQSAPSPAPRASAGFFQPGGLVATRPEGLPAPTRPEDRAAPTQPEDRVAECQALLSSKIERPALLSGILDHAVDTVGSGSADSASSDDE